jgi:hypothetical protein
MTENTNKTNSNTMKAEAIRAFKDKLFWFTVPFLIGLFTWIVVTIYAISSSVSIIQKGEMYSKENQTRMIATQEKIYNTANEARSFSLQNNNILTNKADKVDLDRLDQRLYQIEIKVNKIYIRKGITFSDNVIDTTYNYGHFTSVDITGNDDMYAYFSKADTIRLPNIRSPHGVN